MVEALLFLFTSKFLLVGWGLLFFSRRLFRFFHAVRLIKNLVSSRFSWPSHPGTSADAARCKQSQEQNRSIIVAEEYYIRQGFQNIWQSRIRKLHVLYLVRTTGNCQENQNPTWHIRHLVKWPGVLLLIYGMIIITLFFKKPHDVGNG